MPAVLRLIMQTPDIHSAGAIPIALQHICHCLCWNISENIELFPCNLNSYWEQPSNLSLYKLIVSKFAANLCMLSDQSWSNRRDCIWTYWDVFDYNFKWSPMTCAKQGPRDSVDKKRDWRLHMYIIFMCWSCVYMVPQLCQHCACRYRVFPHGIGDHDQILL